jgi:hypothetical protein
MSMKEKKSKRDWHYVLPPQFFMMSCPRCKGGNIEWSEWEQHIWCYDCEEDLDPGKTEHAGIFSGPIPIENTYLIGGISFDRYIISEDRVERFNIYSCEWEKDWFFKPEEYAKHLLNDDTHKIDNRYGDRHLIEGSKKFKSLLRQDSEKLLYAVLEKYRKD